MFLTRNQLITLTSYKQPSRQIHWLTQHHYAFDVAADGHPRLLTSHVVNVLGGASKQRGSQPDVVGLKSFLAQHG